MSYQVKLYVAFWVLFVVAMLLYVVMLVRRKVWPAKADAASGTSLSPDTVLQTLTIDRFLYDMEREKPIRFSAAQLKSATGNFTTPLGSGGFGTVYKGVLKDGTVAAVKVLHGSSVKKIEEQFMAEVSTIGRIHHVNLVRMYGFCFEKNLTALIYEFMENGSLDRHLFHEDKAIIRFENLLEIAVGTARGIAYLHEECQQRIIHYDIKPGNILLDEKFSPKVADFGLAKLCNRENSHITMTGGRGTPGYAAPELWMPCSVTHKCDVYSFGMLLFEILGRRRNLDINMPQTQEWFPKWVWTQTENGNLREVMRISMIEDSNREVAERMVKVALLCIQYAPKPRPTMSTVVKMLEGAMDIPAPGNPFSHMLQEEIPSIDLLNSTTQTPNTSS